MRVGSPGDHRDHALHAQLRALLNRPFHAIEFEDRQHQGDLCWRGFCRNFFAEIELDASVAYRGDLAAMKDTVRDDIEFLPNVRAQNASEMVRMYTGERGAVSRHFIGNPPSAGHACTSSFFRPVACRLN